MELLVWVLLKTIGPSQNCIPHKAKSFAILETPWAGYYPADIVETLDCHI